MRNDFLDLNVNYLKIFVCVANTGSFKKASIKLAMSQPSVTYSIKNLEKYYDVQLFNRKTDGVTLTPSGEILLEMSKEIFRKMEECNFAMDKINIQESGSINIGMPSHIFLFLKHIIFKFIKSNPGTRISFANDGTNTLLSKLKNDEIDMIIDTAPIIINEKGYVIKKISEEKMCFVYSTKHKENFLISNSIEDILKNPIILPGEESSIRKELQNILNRKEILFTPVFECPTTEIMIEFIKNGLAIGYVFESSVIDYLESNAFTKINVNLELPKIPLCIVEKNNRFNNTANKLIKFIKKECQDE